MPSFTAPQHTQLRRGYRARAPKHDSPKRHEMHSQVGNQAVQQLLRDYRADVSLTGNLQIRRVCSKCQKIALIQRSSATADVGSISGPAESSIRSALGRGEPLPQSSRSFFEPRFGRGLSHVRVHTSPAAARTADEINARAYTLGRDIIFADGQYAPDTGAGRYLLAHEITHTIQQGSGAPVGSSQVQRTIGDGHDLVSPRFSGNEILEAAFDDESLVQIGAHGDHVSLLQQALLDMGYTLPGFGVDGKFGPETKAAIKMFQKDAGAVLVDGIVGPETMGLFDRHDTKRPGGIGPPPRVGPVPGPLPPPNATCAKPFAGVTFTVSHQTGSGANPAGANSIKPFQDNQGAVHPGLFLQGINPPNYFPEIKIHAPDAAKAKEFQVGFASNLLSERIEYFYSSGAVMKSTVPTPIKDGRPLSSGHYDPVFVETQAKDVNEDFTANDESRDIEWIDKPSDAAFVSIEHNSECAALPPGAKVLTGVLLDSFRTWIVVRHRPSGCTQSLHHIDWNTDFQAVVAYPKGKPTITFSRSIINVTEPNGDGSPPFIQGGRVANEFTNSNRVCS